MPKGGRDTSSSSNDLSRMGESLNLTIYSQELGSNDENAVIYFVLPKGKNEATCSESLSLGFHMCIDSGIRAKWLPEVECLTTVPALKNVFVLSSFSGPCYDHLISFYDTLKLEVVVIGPQCIRLSLEGSGDIPIRNNGHPMFTLAMQDTVITFTGYTESDKRAEKGELEKLVGLMNGTVSKVFTKATTHIVADYLLTEKCKLAYSKETPVMTSEWIKTAWKDSQKQLIQATDSKYVKYTCPIFYNLKICVSQVTSAKKQALKNIIEANGGSYFNELARSSVNVLVIPNPGGEKYRFANEWGIPCVTPSWIEMCKSAGHVLPVENFSVIGDANDIKCSTPTKTQKTNFFPAIESMIRNTSRMEVEATFSTTRSESFSSNVNAEVLNVVKRASDEGPFLDGCKIYLCGSGSDTMEQVRKLLNGSGASRLNRLDEHVTHVLIVGSKIPDEDLNRLQKLNPKPHLVNMGWLLESAKQGSPADEDVYCFNIESRKASDKSRKNLTSQLTPSLNIAELVERKAHSAKEKLSGVFNTPKAPHPLNIAANLFGNEKQQAAVPLIPLKDALHKKIFALEDLSEIRGPAEDSDSTLGKNDNDNVVSFTEEGYRDEDVDTHAINKIRALSQHNKTAKTMKQNSVQEVSQTMCDGEENDTNFVYPFDGMKFAVHLTVVQEKNDIEEIICEMHGDIVKEDYDIVILPVAYSKESNLIGKSCFTKYWVLDCNEARTTEIPEAKYHAPLLKYKGMRSILEGVVIAVSQYGNSEKSYLATLAMEMGAEYQDVFSRKKTPTTQRSTHLICSVAENEKCTAANRWGVPVVTADWIYDCYRSKKVLSVSNYHPNNEKSESDSTISCIPVTPKAAVATSNKLAQRLTAVSSVVFYPPSTSKPLRPPITVASTNVFATPISVKRKSSEHNTPVSCTDTSDIDVDSQTPVRGRLSSKANYSDLDLVPAQPLEESPLIYGLSRESSRQLKRGFDFACANSPGPDLTSLMFKFKKRTPDSVLMNSHFAEIEKNYPRQTAIFQGQNRTSTNRLPVVKVSLENKMEPTPKQNDFSKKPEFDQDQGQIKENDRLTTKRRKTSDSSVGECPESGAEYIAMDIQEIRPGKSHSVSNHSYEEMNGNGVMKNVVVYISKRCEDIEALTDAIESMGGEVTTELKNVDLTHLIYQGKNAHMSKEVKTVNNANVKVVDPIWVFSCKEKMVLLDEDLYRPGRVSEPAAFPERNVSNSKQSLEALENLLQQQDVDVEDVVEMAYEDTQGRTIKYKKSENKKAKDEDSDEIDGENNNEWVNKDNNRPASANKIKKMESPPKITEKLSEKKSVENRVEEEKGKKGSTVKRSPIENGTSKYKSDEDKNHLDEQTKGPSGKPSRVTRSRSVAQPIDPIENRASKTTGASVKQSEEKVESNLTKPIFIISALPGESKSAAEQVIKKLGGSVSTELSFDFNSIATIAGTLARSEKVLGTVACGQRLLKSSYINACQQQKRFVSQADHVWTLADASNELEKQVVTAANYWFERISKNSQDKPYVKYKVFMRSNKAPALTRLVQAGGGSVVNNIEEANLVVKDKDMKEKLTRDIQVEGPTYLNKILFFPTTEN